MIIVRLMGGLGNQMFQTAFGYALSLEYNDELILEKSGYKHYKIRPCSIEKLDIGKYVCVKEISELKFNSFKYNIMLQTYHVFQKIAKTIKVEHYNDNLYKILSSKGYFFNFDRFFVQHEKCVNNINKIVYGYFQSIKYFKGYEDDIKKLFKISISPNAHEIELLKKINSCDAVGVSMRLQDDYKKSKSLNICDNDFYIRGINYIKKKIPSAKFFIFADDIDRAKKITFPYSVEFIESMNDYQSLRLLYNCKHFVVANSSFSWWGSYLAENKNKIIIAPNRWYTEINDVPSIYYDGLKLMSVRSEI